MVLVDVSYWWLPINSQPVEASQAVESVSSALGTDLEMAGDRLGIRNRSPLTFSLSCNSSCAILDGLLTAHTSKMKPCILIRRVQALQTQT